MKNKKEDTSIKSIIIILFISAMLLSIGSIGYLIFANWYSSSKSITENVAEDINQSIYDQLDAFVRIPYHINEINHKIIQNGILDLNDETLRNKFFVGVLLSHNEEIYSFSYGTVSGEYYGARRNERKEIEIIRNNAETGGNSWYYSVNEDMTAGTLILKAGQFDPRTRAWYKAAVEAESPVFSSVYKHFIIDDLTVSSAWPVFTDKGELLGVIGTHMLLNDIGEFTKNTVNKYKGYAIIFEKDSGNLIANSMGIDNFSVLPDGTLRRIAIGDIENSEFKLAYEKYNADSNPDFIFEGADRDLYINIKEIKMNGLDWVVLSALPEGVFIKPVNQSIVLTVFLSVLVLLLSFVIYNMITRRLFKPINSLIKATEALSSGDLSQRVVIARYDEIGKISESFNKVADKMQFLINNLEVAINEGTNELYITNITLEENKNQLQLILNSTAEAIYGIDLNGDCTFCNISCLKLLGYNSQEDLLGKNMHQQIHHSNTEGVIIPKEECRIIEAIKRGKGLEANDEVFWRADGTYFDVEYHSYPQIKNGKVVGGVITFMDITNRKKREDEIKYLSFHDMLTGLPNRRCFEDNLKLMDIPDNLPLSIIFADINGLKMTNDIFGHASGDKLIKKASEILMLSCRNDDVIARTGGDEFIMLLPKTNKENAEKILTRIKREFLTARIAAMKCSISLGLDTKISSEQSLEEIISNAENEMYKDKTINRKDVNKDIIDTIVETLHSRNPREKQHSVKVSELCGKVGIALKLPEPQINILMRAGYLHDIGKITLDESIFSRQDLTEEELEKVKQHSVMGYRILNLFDESLDLAEYVYSHHERWDGKGYPRGLKGEQIPLLSRIVSIVEVYERVLSRGELSLEERKQNAIQIVKEGAGEQFDPQIAELFARMMEEKV